MGRNLVRLVMSEEGKTIIEGTAIKVSERDAKPVGFPIIVSSLVPVSTGAFIVGNANAYVVGQRREVTTTHGCAVLLPVQFYNIPDKLFDQAHQRYGAARRLVDSARAFE